MADKSHSNECRRLSFISEASSEENLNQISSCENDAVNDEQKWAVTKLVTHKDLMSHDRKVGKKSENGNLNLPAVRAKLAAAELEKRCPALSLPKLHCFTSFLDDVSPDADQIIKEVETKLKKHEQRKKTVKQVRRMYHLSQSNAATTRRILENSENSLSIQLERPDVSDLIAENYLTSSGRKIKLSPLAVSNSSSSSPHQTNQTLQSTKDKLPATTFDCSLPNDSQQKEKTCAVEEEPSSDHWIRCSQKVSSSEIGTTPLNMDDVISQGRILKPRHRSNVWLNYAG